MSTIQIVLMVLAVALLGVAAIGGGSRWVSFGWLGLAVWALASLVPALDG